MKWTKLTKDNMLMQSCLVKTEDGEIAVSEYASLSTPQAKITFLAE